MRFSRRAVEVGGLGVVLACCAAAFVQPLLLFGAAGVGAWLLGRQRAFVAAAERADESLTVRTHVTNPSATVDREFPVVVTVELDEAVPLSLSVEPEQPVAGTLTESSTIRLEPGDTGGDLTYAVAFHVAGMHDLPSVAVTLADERGLFEETVVREAAERVVVDARGPSGLHVGRGASGVSEEFGSRQRQISDRGLEPQEVREYVPGDLAKNIDWNVTARLGDLHVREYGRENDRRVLVILDQREAMAVGPPGETKFDYAREVTLGVLANVGARFDSVALYGVDDDAITVQYSAETAEGAAETLRGPLFELGVTKDGADGERPSATGRYVSARSRARVAKRLRGGETTFDRVLGEYLSARRPEPVEESDPIREAISRERSATDDELSAVVVTDDTEPRRVWDVVQFGTRAVDQVSLFLTPHVLFEPGGLDDLETAYERYLEFEEFRRELDGLPNVTAFEVGPGDRLSAIVESRRAE